MVQSKCANGRLGECKICKITGSILAKPRLPAGRFEVGYRLHEVIRVNITKLKGFIAGDMPKFLTLML